MIFSENMKVLEFILFAKSLVMVLSEILIYIINKYIVEITMTRCHLWNLSHSVKMLSWVCEHLQKSRYT